MASHSADDSRRKSLTARMMRFRCRPKCSSLTTAAFNASKSLDLSTRTPSDTSDCRAKDDLDALAASTGSPTRAAGKISGQSLLMKLFIRNVLSNKARMHCALLIPRAQRTTSKPEQELLPAQ